jgi:YjbE family integral membrane protein
MAAAGTPKEIRQKVIFYGIGVAVVMRIGFALIAVQMLHIVGILFAGGLLLLWVCWKLFREIISGVGHETVEEVTEGENAAPTKTMGQAIWQILIADLSMSLDNVLAVAGAAREHPYIMAIGLLMSIVLMAVAATFIARLLARFHWLAWLGLAAILYVAAEMLWEGGHQIYEAVYGIEHATEVPEGEVTIPEAPPEAEAPAATPAPETPPEPAPAGTPTLPEPTTPPT